MLEAHRNHLEYLHMHTYTCHYDVTLYIFPWTYNYRFFRCFL